MGLAPEAIWKEVGGWVGGMGLGREQMSCEQRSRRQQLFRRCGYSRLPPPGTFWAACLHPPYPTSPHPYSPLHPPSLLQFHPLALVQCASKWDWRAHRKACPKLWTGAFAF